MRISSGEIDNVLRAYRRQKLERTGEESPSAPGERGGTDEVDFSERAQLMREVRTRLEEVPEVRQDRVEELTEQIASGEYEVESREVAERILRRGIVDRLV